MSTSITGYRFTSTRDPFEAAALIRAHLRPAVTAHDLRDAFGQIVSAIDSADARQAQRPGQPWRDFSRQRTRERRDGIWPGSSRCYVFLGTDPGVDPDTSGHAAGDLLAVVNAHPDFGAAMLTIPGVEDFSFTNATDLLPDGVDAEDYAARRAVWGRALPSGAPLHDMLQVAVRYDYDPDLSRVLRERRTEPGPLLDVAPSTARRARDVAMLITLDALIAAHPEEPPGDLVGPAMFDTPVAVIESSTEALDPDLPAVVASAFEPADLDASPAPDLTAARTAARRWASQADDD